MPDSGLFFKGKAEMRVKQSPDNLQINRGIGAYRPKRKCTHNFGGFKVVYLFRKF